MGILGMHCVCLLKNKMAAESNLQMVKMKTMPLLLPFYFLPVITKKERSSEIIENPTPNVWPIYFGHDTVVSDFQMR